MTEVHTTHAASYVRGEMLPQKAPPVTEVGIIKWLRENLFSSWLNAILTVLSLAFVYVVLASVLPWAMNGIWDAGSLTECRAIRDELYAAERAAAEAAGHHYNVACWAVLSDRWHQLVFGYYPQDQYWRPILALVVFLAAVSPILFPERVSSKVLVLTGLMPFICYWLIWGGSVWHPVALLGGLVLGYAVYHYGKIHIGTVGSILAGVVLAFLYFKFAFGPIWQGLAGVVPLELEFVSSRYIGGFTLALKIGLSAIILSLPLGILLALGRQSDLFIINKFSVGFIEIIRGVPLIVWLFTAQLLLNYFLPPGTSFDLTLRVIIMVTFFASAYIAEVIRGGLAALPKGQYEGADSLGLNYWQSMRLIILPQALKISIPGIVNTFIGLFKDTTLVVFIGLSDPIGIINAIRADTNWNGVYWEPYIFVAIMFFVVCFSMGRYSLYLERKLQREHR